MFGERLYALPADCEGFDIPLQFTYDLVNDNWAKPIVAQYTIPDN